MNPLERIKRLLVDGRAINMVLTYQSRTRRKRGYKLFVIDPATHHNVNVTFDVCAALGVPWNDQRATIDFVGKVPTYDPRCLGLQLTTATGIRINVATL